MPLSQREVMNAGELDSGPPGVREGLLCPEAMRLLAPIVLLGCCLLNPARGSAQAWMPLKGEGSVSITFQHVRSAGHFLEDGSQFPGYETRASNVSFDVAYGVTERLALDASLPYMNTKYAGKEAPMFPDAVLDDGRYHGSLQDWRFGFRYNALERPFAATPFFAAVIPSHSYGTIGEAAAGRGLREYTAGVYMGRLLHPVLRKAYVHGMYSYSFVEKVLDIGLNRSNVDAQIGYLITPSVSLSFLWRRVWTHGGLDFGQLYTAPSDVFGNFDRVTRQNFQHIGAGAELPLGESASVHLNVVKFVSGVNAHYGMGVAAGVSWSFQTRRGSLISTAGQPPVRYAGLLKEGVSGSHQ